MSSKYIAIRMDKSQYERLRVLAANSGVHHTEMARRLIAAALEFTENLQNSKK